MKFSLNRPNWEKEFTEYRKYYILTGIDNDDKTTLKVPVFEDGNLEKALYWRKKFEELIELKGLTTAAQRFTNASLLLAGPAKEKWNEARHTVLNPTTAQQGQANITLARFQQTMTLFIQKCGATASSAEDLRDFLMTVRKPSHMKFSDFKTRIIELDYYLPYLPPPLNTRIGEATLFSTLKKSVPAWKEKFISANVGPAINQNISLLTDYYEQLEEEEEKQQARRNRQSQNQDNGNQNKNSHQNNEAHGRGRNDNHHNYKKGNPNNSGNEYRRNENNQSQSSSTNRNSNDNESISNSQRNQNSSSNRYNNSSNQNQNRHQHRYNTRYQERRQRNENNHVDEEYDNETQSSQEGNENYCNDELYNIEDNLSEAVQRNDDYRPEIVIAIPKDPHGKEKILIRALIDSGSNKTHANIDIIPKWILDKTTIYRSDNKVHGWKSKFTTQKLVQLPFIMTQFSTNSKIVHEVYLSRAKKLNQYATDMIIGRDIIRKLGLNLNFYENTPVITWKERSVPMVKYEYWTRNRNKLQEELFSQQKSNSEVAKESIDSKKHKRKTTAIIKRSSNMKTNSIKPSKDTLNSIEEISTKTSEPLEIQKVDQHLTYSICPPYKHYKQRYHHRKKQRERYGHIQRQQMDIVPCSKMQPVPKILAPIDPTTNSVKLLTRNDRIVVARTFDHYQRLTDKRYFRAKTNRIKNRYFPKDFVQVLIQQFHQGKLAKPTCGPYQVIDSAKQFINGTIVVTLNHSHAYTTFDD